MLSNGDLRYWIQIAAIAMLVVAAWRVGAGPERVLAGLLAWFYGADAIHHAIVGWQPASDVGIGHLAIDSVGLLVAGTVALSANRIYPLWFAAFQLIALMAHLARNVADGTQTAAYQILFMAPSFVQIIILACGIALHRRRVRRYGPYRSWRTSSPPSRASTRPTSPSA